MRPKCPACTAEKQNESVGDAFALGFVLGPTLKGAHLCGRHFASVMRRQSAAKGVCPECGELWQPQDATTCGPCGGYVPNGPVPQSQKEKP